MSEIWYTNSTGKLTKRYTYSHTADGNLSEFCDVSAGKAVLYQYDASGVVQYQYVYDDRGQLVREDNRVTGYSYEYYYDNGGNITAKKRYAFTTGALGMVQETIGYTYADTNSTGWGDLLTSFNGDAITYDEIGNPTSIGSYLNMTWEGRRLVEYDNANKESVFGG